MPSSRRSASVDWGQAGSFRPESLQLLDLPKEDDDELSPLVCSPTTETQKKSVKTQSLNLDQAPGWENFAEEFRAQHQMRRPPKGKSPGSPGWDRSKNLSNISVDFGNEDAEVWTDSDEDNHSPMTSPQPETVMINMARIGARHKPRSVSPKPSSLKYQVEMDEIESSLPGVPTMQTPTNKGKRAELGYTHRPRPRSKSVDGLANCEGEPWLRCTEPARFADEDSDGETSSQNDDLLCTMAKKVHRLRGSFKLAGECIAFSSALVTVIVMIRVAVYVEEELKSWNGARDNELAQQKHDCSQALLAYRVYYMLALSLALLMTLLSSLVVFATIRNLLAMDVSTALRTIADELGFLEHVDESAYKLCSGLKWVAKFALLLTLYLGAYESQQDSFLHGHICDAKDDVAGNMTWWFVLGSTLRTISAGWDIVLTCLPFICVKHFYPELYSSHLNTEETHAVLGDF